MREVQRLRRNHILAATNLAVMAILVSSMLIAVPAVAMPIDDGGGGGGGTPTYYDATLYKGDQRYYIVLPWLDPVMARAEVIASVRGYDTGSGFSTTLLYDAHLSLFFRAGYQFTVFPNPLSPLLFGITWADGYVDWYQVTWKVESNKRGALLSYTSNPIYGPFGRMPAGMDVWYDWNSGLPAIALMYGETITVTSAYRVVGHVVQNVIAVPITFSFDWYLSAQVTMTCK